MKGKHLGLIFVALFILGSGTVGLAEIGFPGGGGGTVFQIPVGVRAIAMGEAHVAVADGIFAAYWNPAGINYVREGGFSVASMMLWRDVVHNDFGFLIRRNKLAFSTRFSRFSVDGIHAFDSMGRLKGEFSQSIEILNFAMGINIFSNLSFGLAVKGYHKFFFHRNTLGYTFDFGIYGLAPKKLQYGLVVQNAFLRNIGKEFQYDPIMPTYRIGISWSLYNGIILASDIIILPKGYINSAVGVSYDFNRFLLLRMGFSGLNFRSGIGLQFGNLGIDYAIVKNEVNVFHTVQISFFNR